MSTQIITISNDTKIAEWAHLDDTVEKVRDALGSIMDANQFIAQMMVAFQEPQVMECSTKSKATALMTCAAMGLLPTIDQVKLIPYKVYNEKKQFVGIDIKAMPQWQGMKALMERHKSILEVTGHLVHKEDDFAFQNGEVYHVFDPFDETREIKSGKDILGGYCKILYVDGRPPKYHFVPVKEIEKRRACAQTQKVWSQWYAEMALKTLYRDAYARRAVPFDPLVQVKLDKIFTIEDVDLGNNHNWQDDELKQKHLANARKMRLLESQEPEEKETDNAELKGGDESDEAGVWQSWKDRIAGCNDDEDLEAARFDLDQDETLDPGQKDRIALEIDVREKALST